MAPLAEPSALETIDSSSDFSALIAFTCIDISSWLERRVSMSEDSVILELFSFAHSSTAF